jgi:hypothetical protein
MRAVDVPLVDHKTCQQLLRETRLGKNFKLNADSFVCAGGEVAKGIVELIKVGNADVFFF